MRIYLKKFMGEKMKTIMHNTLTVDGKYKGFMPDMGIHYGITARYNAKVILVGSGTAVTGLSMFGEIAKEEKTDFQKPTGKDHLAMFAIVDHSGKLNGKLHTFRRSEYCKDVIIIASKKTPKKYIEYLKERNYDFFICGDSLVDLKKAIDEISIKYDCDKIVVDSGPGLNNALLQKNLIDEISIVTAPITLPKEDNFFRVAVELELINSERLDKGYVWNQYNVKK